MYSQMEGVCVQHTANFQTGKNQQVKQGCQIYGPLATYAIQLYPAHEIISYVSY